MHLDWLEIQNYKSLRSIAIEPTPLSVLVGPNASGKTNFADALEFLGIAYRWGLEEAVAAKGGYENICYRSSSRRSKAPVIFHVSFRSRIEDVVFDLDHDFELKTRSHVRRPGAETLIDPLPRLDPTVTEAWGQGKFTLSEYLDSGALPEAVPAASSGR